MKTKFGSEVTKIIFDDSTILIDYDIMDNNKVLSHQKYIKIFTF